MICTLILGQGLRGDVTDFLEISIAGSILRQFELECRWEHSVQWIHRRSYPGVGCWSCLRDASKVLISYDNLNSGIVGSARDSERDVSCFQSHGNSKFKIYSCFEYSFWMLLLKFNVYTLQVEMVVWDKMMVQYFSKIWFSQQWIDLLTDVTVDNILKPGLSMQRWRPHVFDLIDPFIYTQILFKAGNGSFQNFVCAICIIECVSRNWSVYKYLPFHIV